MTGFAALLLTADFWLAAGVVALAVNVAARLMTAWLRRRVRMPARLPPPGTDASVAAEASRAPRREPERLAAWLGGRPERAPLLLQLANAWLLEAAILYVFAVLGYFVAMRLTPSGQWSWAGALVALAALVMTLGALAFHANAQRLREIVQAHPDGFGSLPAE